MSSSALYSVCTVAMMNTVGVITDWTVATRYAVRIQTECRCKHAGNGAHEVRVETLSLAGADGILRRGNGDFCFFEPLEG